MKKIVIFQISIAALVFLAAVCLLLGGKPGRAEFQLKEKKQAAALSGEQVPTTEAPKETVPPETEAPPETEPPQAIQMPEITWKTFAEGQSVTASRAFVYDCQTGQYLYTKGDAEETLYIASITKLFAIETAAAHLPLDREIKVTSGPLSYLPEAASRAGLQSGDVLTVEQLYGSILLPSGNDAAYVLAAATGREIAQNPDLPVSDAIAVFVQEMNQRAATLGLKNTHFENPVGFHSTTHYTCFDDLVTVAKRIWEMDAVMQFAALDKATITPVTGRAKALENTNALVNPNSQYYCPYAVGLKTGHTIAADYCLLAVFDIEGHRYIVGAFGCPGYNGRYNDALLLFNRYVIGQENF